VDRRAAAVSARGPGRRKRPPRAALRRPPRHLAPFVRAPVGDSRNGCHFLRVSSMTRAARSPLQDPPGSLFFRATVYDSTHSPSPVSVALDRAWSLSTEIQRPSGSCPRRLSSGAACPLTEVLKYRTAAMAADLSSRSSCAPTRTRGAAADVTGAPLHRAVLSWSARGDAARASRGCPQPSALQCALLRDELRRRLPAPPHAVRADLSKRAPPDTRRRSIRCRVRFGDHRPAVDYRVSIVRRSPRPPHLERSPATHDLCVSHSAGRAERRGRAGDSRPSAEEGPGPVGARATADLARGFASD